MIQAVAKEKGAVFVPLDALFCSNGLCWVESGQDILFRDADHMTNQGSDFVAPRISAALGF